MPPMGRAWVRLGLAWVAWAGPERRGPERLDTSEGSGHFLNKNLASSLANPHVTALNLEIQESENPGIGKSGNLEPRKIQKI